MERSSRREFLKKAAGAAAALGVGYTFLWEPSNLEVTKTDVPIRDLPKPFEGFTIGVLSDYHFGSAMTESFARKCALTLCSHNPDVIVIPGDFINSRAVGWEDLLIRSLEPLQAPFGVFGTLGNHDHVGDTNHLVDVLKQHTPVRLMINERVALRRGTAEIALCGTDDLRKGAYRPEAALGGIAENQPRIMIQHQPDAAEELAAGWRVDLQISGHMHGGQNALFRGMPGFLPSRYGSKFVMGLVQGKSHRVYVTRGVGGLHPGRPRFLCRPEATLLRLVPFPVS
jgi:uncharacterized protein